MRLRGSPIPLIERAYAGLDLPRDEWLDSLREEAERLFDGVAGSAQAFQIRIGGEHEIETLGLAAAEPYRSAFLTMHRLAPTGIIERLYLRGPVATVGNVLPRRASTLRGVMKATGVPDVVGTVGLDPSGRGVGLSWLRLRAEASLSRQVRHTLTRIAAHVASAARLRERGTGALEDAVLAPDGRVVDAQRDARDAETRDALRAAAQRIDRARMRRAASEPSEAAEAWRALVDARWSLVERFESDGRRFLVARRNDPTTRALRALTERERKVVALTALGHPLKVAAYELGLSVSTVSLTLRQAMDKMGVPTRAALVELHGAVIRASDESAEDGAAGAPDHSEGARESGTPRRSAQR